MMEDYIIDLEKIEDMLVALRKGWREATYAIKIGDFEEVKRNVTNLGGTILLFDEEVRKLSLPHFALKLRGGDEK